VSLAGGRKRSIARSARSPPHHQIISETSWAAAGTPPIINYPFSLSLSLLRPFGSLAQRTLDFASLSCILHASRHFACKNFALENLTSHTPHCLHLVGGSICSTQAAAAPPHLNGKYFVSAHTLHSGPISKNNFADLFGYMIIFELRMSRVFYISYVRFHKKFSCFIFVGCFPKSSHYQNVLDCLLNSLEFANNRKKLKIYKLSFCANLIGFLLVHLIIWLTNASDHTF